MSKAATAAALARYPADFWTRVQICVHGLTCRRCCWDYRPHTSVRDPERYKMTSPARLAWEPRPRFPVALEDELALHALRSRSLDER